MVVMRTMTNRLRDAFYLRSVLARKTETAGASGADDDWVSVASTQADLDDVVDAMTDDEAREYDAAVSS